MADLDDKGVPPHVAEWHELIRKALPEGYDLEFVGDPALVPLVKLPPTFDGMYRFLKEILPKLPGVSGGRMYAEGVVLEPRLPRAEPLEWPYTEPEVLERARRDGWTG